MNVKKDNIDRWFDHNVLLDTRTIMLADSAEEGVGDNMANNFIKGMHLLEQKVEPVRVLLRSAGGCSFAGMAIYDCIAQSPCHVTADVIGSAMSMGAVILQACDLRRMHPHALLMVHDGTFTVDDNTRTFENWAGVARKLRGQMYEIFAKRSKRSKRYWEKRCASDFIMTAEEAMSEGLIDEIIQPVADPSGAPPV